MPSKEGDRLALYSLAVRESSLKRLRLVDNGKENWRIDPKTMSFADVAQHLINSDKWLFKKLEIKTQNAEMGEAGKINIKKRIEYIALLEELIATGHARAFLLRGITDTELDEEIEDNRFGGKTTVWWVIVRGNLDHETHHRGEIGSCLSKLQSERNKCPTRASSGFGLRARR